MLARRADAMLPFEFGENALRTLRLALVWRR
jgi:hypothetical protein